MKRKVLLAADESSNSEKAVTYVTETMPSDARVTLLSIIPDSAAACELDAPSLVPLFKKNQEAFCQMEDTKRDNLKNFLYRGKERLVKAGFNPGSINIRIRKKRKGIARDILQEARQGGYDTLVIGRRGMSGVKEFFLGGVSTKVLHHASGMTVIVVD